MTLQYGIGGEAEERTVSSDGSFNLGLVNRQDLYNSVIDISIEIVSFRDRNGCLNVVIT